MNKGDLRVSFGWSEKRGQGAKERRGKGMLRGQVRGRDPTVPASDTAKFSVPQRKPLQEHSKAGVKGT